MRACKSARAITRRYDAALAAHGLTSGQFSILAAPAGAQAQAATATIWRLAALLDPEQSAASRAVQDLVRTGWIAATPKSGDRRSRAVSIRPGAYAGFEAAAVTWCALQDAETAPVTKVSGY